MRLIYADQFGVISLQGKSEDFIEGVAFMFDKIHEAPTVEAYTHYQVQDLIALNKKLSEERLHDETEYKAKMKELEDAISRCEQAEKEFKRRTCKFRSPTNCDFCSFHSDCGEHWKEGDENG